MRPWIRIQWSAPPADVYTTVYGAVEEAGGESAVPMGRQRNVVPYVSHPGLVLRQYHALLAANAASHQQLRQIDHDDRPASNPVSYAYRQRYNGDQKGIMLGFEGFIANTEPAVVGARNVVEQTVDNVDAGDDED